LQDIKRRYRLTKLDGKKVSWKMTIAPGDVLCIMYYVLFLQITEHNAHQDLVVLVWSSTIKM